MKKLLFLFPMLLCACPPNPAPVPPDASDAATTVVKLEASDIGTQVCAHLATIGCPQPATCANTINTKQGSITDFKTSCLLNATSVTGADACGSIHCN
jgi:hypothetical protein